MSINLKTKIALSFVIAGVSLYVVLSAAKSSLEAYVQRAEAVSDEFGTFVDWMKVTQTYQLAEIQQLEYVLTGKKRYLDNYQNSKSLIEDELATLRNRLHPGFAEYLKLYERLLQRKFAIMDRAVAAREVGQVAALQVLFHGEGREITEKLGRLREELRAALDKSVKHKVSRSQEGTLSATLSMDWLAWVCLLLFGVIGIFLIYDAHKHQKYENVLVEAERAAIRASNFKSQFLAHMSHEIRTPLNSIIAIGDLLGEGSSQDEELKLVATLRRASKSLLRIVNEILDLSKVEAGALTLENIEFDLATLLEDLRNLAWAQAKEKGINFIIENRVEADRSMYGDSTRLQQVLMNLIGNAIKFTSRGQVAVRVTEVANNFVQFAVEDTGVGMSKEALGKLFVPFQQAEASTSRYYGGTGLGLVICKQIVELMGGRIHASSEPGKGSVFTFAVPIVAEHGRQVSRRRESENVVRGNFVTAPARKLNILVVDDVNENLEMIRLFLRTYNWNLRFATTGVEALELFKSEEFDLVLLDMQMPIMDGRTAAKQMRNYEAKTGRARIPIVALTAEAFPEEKRSCLESGCDLHLTKPIRKQELLNALAGLGFNVQLKKVA